MKNQKGSISMFVIVSVLFLTFVLIGIYTSYANKQNGQKEQVEKIQENYNKNTSENEMYNIYLSKLPPEIGDYVKYNVSYTDMYTGYKFTATDGWRILDTGKKNKDGTYSNVKLISTGVPVFLNYKASQNIGNAANGWWGTDEQVKQLYGETYATGYNNYKNRYTATGLQMNFELIPFTAGTSAEYNEGCFIEINSINSGTITGNIFKAEGASRVHCLTLEELNTARGLPTDNTTGTFDKDADTGLFYLRDLQSENSAFKVVEEQQYWLGTPPINYKESMRLVTLIGGIGSISSSIQGIRPVITLSSRIKIISEGHWEIVE